MSDDTDEWETGTGGEFSPELLKRRIAARLKALDLTPITAATLAELPRDTIRNIFRPTASGLPRIDTMTKIAAALQTSVAYLVGENSLPDIESSNVSSDPDAGTPKARKVEIVASSGVEPQLPPDDSDYFYLNIPGFEDVDLRAIRIGDDSADTAYPPICYAVFADKDAVGLRAKEHVVLRSTVDGQHQYRVMEYLPHPTPRLNGEIGFASLASDLDRWPDVTVARRENNEFVWGVVVAEVRLHARPKNEAVFAAFEPPDLWGKTDKKLRKRGHDTT